SEIAYTHDGPHVLCEHRDGAMAAQYVFDDGIDCPIQIAAEGTEHWYHADVTRSIRMLTDRTGARAAEYRYRPFGETLEEPAGGPYDPIRHAGRRLAAALGLYDCRFRAYDPAVGRFLQPDPLGM